MLLTHPSDCGQISLAQPRGVTLTGVLTRGKKLHTHAKKELKIPPLKIGAGFLYYEVLGCQSDAPGCASSAALDQLSALPLVGSSVRNLGNVVLWDV